MEYPVRILHIIGSMNFGGSENYVMNLYRNIDRTKIQFDFLINRNGVFDDEIKQMGGKIYQIDALQKVGPFIYTSKLKKFFREHQEYYIVHSHLSQVNGLILKIAKESGIKVRIAHSHSSNNALNLINRIYKNYLNTKISKNATDLFACSKLAADWLYKEKSKDAIIMKNAIEIDRFKFNKETRETIRKELNIGENEIVFGHVGRFSEVKNHKLIIDIFNEYQKENMDSKLLLVGDGPLRQNIEKQIEDLGLKDKVILVGNQKKVENYYNVMDVFLFPSLYEGLGMVLIEAQINGLKCFTSKDVVPEEVNITDNVNFISLTSKISEWVDALNKVNMDRYNEVEKIKSAGYDVKLEVKRLEEFYLKK